MAVAYFISDVHLATERSVEEQRKQARLNRFFKQIRSDATHLFIVGDFFDFWFEYKYVIPKAYFNFLYMLKELTETGVEVHYLAGNHDFALGTFLDEQVGIKTWPEEQAIELDGKKFYLFHGDGVAKNDGAYRALRKILRNPFNQKLFRWLHPDAGIPFARFASGTSRSYTNQNNHLRDESDYIEFARGKFAEGFDYVLMGHRHNPLEHEENGRKYINLGDWLENFTYARFDGEELKLLSYKETENEE